MPREELIAVALATAASLLGLVALYRWPYRHYRIDRFRDEIFEVRAQLFRLAATGRLEFNDTAYGMLRSTLNGFIRFGHQLDLTSLFAIACTENEGKRSSNARDFASEWKKALDCLDCSVRVEIERLERRMHRAVILHLFLSSPPLLLLALPLIFVIMIPVVAVRVSTWLWKQATPVLNRVDSAALRIGTDRNGEPQPA